MSTTPESEDFFRSRLDQMIDLRRPLPQLTLRMPWQALEASIAHLFARKARAGQRIDDMDLFGDVLQEKANKIISIVVRKGFFIFINLLIMPLKSILLPLHLMHHDTTANLSNFPFTQEQIVY